MMVVLHHKSVRCHNFSSSVFNKCLSVRVVGLRLSHAAVLENIEP